MGAQLLVCALGAKLDLPLCGDCAEIFSLGNQLVRTRVPFSILNPSSKSEGRLLSCCSLPRLEQPTPHSPEKLPGLGSRGLVCSWSLLLMRRLSRGSCIEADLCHIHSLRDQGRQGASEGDAEVKHTHQPCPLNLEGPKRQLGTAAEPCGLGALALSEDSCRLRPPLGVRYFWVLYLCFQSLLMEPATTNLPWLAVHRCEGPAQTYTALPEEALDVPREGDEGLGGRRCSLPARS